LEDLSVDGELILKFIFKKWDWGVWFRLVRVWTGTGGGLSIKCGV